MKDIFSCLVKAMSLKFRNSRKTSKKGVLDALIWCHLYLAFTGVEVPKKQSFKVLALNFLLIKKEREGRKKKGVGGGHLSQILKW